MILVSGNGKLAKELGKLSTDSLPVTILSRKEMDITDGYMVSDVIKDFMMNTEEINNPEYNKYITNVLD